MAGLARKEVAALLKSLEEQGCRLDDRGSHGVMVLFPNGFQKPIHWTSSDRRAMQRIRSAVRQQGLEWPFDKQTRKR